MKKKRIILASILGATAFIAGASAVTVAVINNNNNKLQEEQNETFIESTTAEDDIFAGGMPSLIADREVKRLSNNVVDLTKPQIGYQYAYDSENDTVSIRYFAAIKDPNVTATWTRALYDNEGNISSKLPMGTKQSAVAYEKLAYMDGSKVNYISAKEYGCSYFVVYSLVGIPVATYNNYNLVAKVELSDGSNSVQSDAGSITTSSKPTISKIEAGIYLNSTTKSHNEYNGTYIYNQVKTLYKTNEELDLRNVSVVLSEEEVTASGYTKGNTGKQTVTLTCGDVTKDFDVYVLNIENQITDSCVATVDQSYADSVIGTFDSTDGYKFKTISQALEFLQNTSFVASSAVKTLNIKAGTYNEKLEINTPNLTIVGAGRDTTTIEYDSLYGMVEANGFNNVTDSTQTVAVRKTATNCKISGVTISNKYNSIESFAGTKYEGKGERGLALLVQADQFYVDSCKILGWQDTLELFTGRQYFKNTYISGCIDYIFGTNNTTFFDGCEIHTVKGKTGANSENVNAYVTAFKGTNYDDGRDSIEYGAIFKGCNFTSDSDFVGTYALARPWNACSSVAALNSTFDGNFDTDEARTIATGLLKDVNLSSLNIKFYGNKDSSNNALSITNTDGLSNVDMSLTAEQAADYLDFDVAFGKSNGNVSYALAWDPTAEPVVEKNIEFSSTGNYNTFVGVDLTEFTSTEVKSNTVGFRGKIKVSLAAKSLVQINGYDGYVNYTVDDNKVIETSTFYYATAGTLVIDTDTTTSYINSIHIYENVDAPETATLKSLSLSGQPISEFAVGDDCDISDLKVKAIYTDGTYQMVTNYTTNVATAVDKTKAGVYTVTVTYNDGTIEKTATFDVTYVATIDNTISEDIITSFKGNNYSNYNATVFASTFNSSSNPVTINKITYSGIASNGSAGNWITVANGSTITLEVNDACALYVAYFDSTTLSRATVKLGETTISKYRLFNRSSKAEIEELGNQNGDFARYVIPESGTITISFSGSGYLGAVGVLFNDGVQDVVDTVIDKNTTISFGSSGNYKTYIGNGMKSTAAISDNGGNNSQVKEGALTLKVKENATVTVYGYGGSKGTGNSDYTYYTVTANGATSSEQHDDYSVTVTADGDVVITPTNGNNYLMSIEVSYPETVKVISTTTRIAFGNGDSSNYQTLITNGYLTDTCQHWDNAGNSTRLHAGSLEFYVNSGATVTIFGNSSVDYVANGTAVSGSVDYNTGQHVVEYGSDGKITIECDTDSTGDNYFYWIDVTY